MVVWTSFIFFFWHVVVGCDVAGEVDGIVGVGEVVGGHWGLCGRDGKGMIRIENEDKLGWIYSVSHYGETMGLEGGGI